MVRDLRQPQGSLPKDSGASRRTSGTTDKAATESAYATSQAVVGINRSPVSVPFDTLQQITKLGVVRYPCRSDPQAGLAAPNVAHVIP